MPQHNAPAINLMTDRYSHHIRVFNNTPGLTMDDSDTHADLYRELAELATTALTRAPWYETRDTRVKHSRLIPSLDLGNVRMLMRRHFTDAERARYDEIQEALHALADKYED